jgi:hypothetical protein
MEITYNQHQNLLASIGTLHCEPATTHLQQWELQKENLLHEQLADPVFVYDLWKRDTELFLPGCMTGIPGITSLREEMNRLRPEDVNMLAHDMPEVITRIKHLYPEFRHKCHIYLYIAVNGCDGVYRLYFITLSVLQLDANRMPWLIKLELKMLNEPYTFRYEPHLWCNVKYGRNSPHCQIATPIHLTEKRKLLLRLYSEGYRGKEVAYLMGTLNRNQRGVRYNMLQLFGCHSMDSAVEMAKRMKII